jgi:cysteine-rich repeat protein
MVINERNTASTIVAAIQKCGMQPLEPGNFTNEAVQAALGGQPSTDAAQLAAYVDGVCSPQTLQKYKDAKISVSPDAKCTSQTLGYVYAMLNAGQANQSLRVGVIDKVSGSVLPACACIAQINVSSSSGGSSSAQSASGQSSSGQSFSGQGSSGSNGSDGSYGSSSAPGNCPANPCNDLATTFCERQGRTCAPDPTSSSCFTCGGGPYQCMGSECEIGGSDYCGQTLDQGCNNRPDLDICIECAPKNKPVCPAAACAVNNNAGDKFCAQFGKECHEDSTTDACITCEPEPPLDCSAQNYCDNPLAKSYCESLGQGMSCTPTKDGICIACLAANQCSPGADYCGMGGSAYCNATGGGACQQTDSGLCISCGGQEQTQYQCMGNECRKGGALFCGARGLGCDNTGQGVCIACTADTGCTSSLECAEGSQCINGGCIRLCGNKRIDAGEACDGGPGCSADCRLEESQQCDQDTQCQDNLCLKKTCVPCTNGDQCQSGQCNAGSCISLCGNGTVDNGEMCDPGLSGLSDTCTSDCLLPVGASCKESAGCQTGLCKGSTCAICTSNAECGSGACAAGACVDTCGDGQVDAGTEECDDGNRIEGDGCSRFCRRSSTVAGEILPISLLGNLTGNRGNNQDTQAAQAERAIAGIHAAAGKTGPAAVVVIASGAAAGWSYMRRKKKVVQ